MKTLRVVVAPSWPREEAACQWLLFGSEGRILQRGRSEPRHWPVPAPGEDFRREAILSCPQATVFETGLPAARKGRDTRVIGYALEDRLLDDSESYHFVPGEKPLPSGKFRVVATDRQRLGELVAGFATLQHPLDGMYLATDWLSPVQSEPDDWAVWLQDGASVLLAGGASLWLSDSMVTAPPPALAWAIAAATPRPQRLTLVADGVSCDAGTWHAALGLDIDVVELNPLEQARPAAAINLLRGEFAPVRKHPIARQLRPAAIAAMAFAAIYLATGLAEWSWLAWQGRMLRNENARTFASALPQTPLVDAPVQMQRAVDVLRHRRGQLGDGDFLAIMRVLAGATPAPPSGLRYAGSTLQADYALAAAQCIALAQSLRAGGLAVAAPSGGQACRLAVRAGGGS